VTIVGLIGLCIALVFSPWGKLRLGAPDSRPEFSRFTWVSMLLSAGVGIGILFFGVAEPMFYFDNSGGFGYPNNPHADLAGHMAMDHARAVDALKGDENPLPRHRIFWGSASAPSRRCC
tara:strand:- start:5092 stop:5448 length:357 start_codon:yes stop_codon:yes gene_type:complete